MLKLRSRSLLGGRTEAATDQPGPASRRAAVIDIGSNSVRLVVYDGPPRAPGPIFNEKVAAGLGRGVAENGLIRAADADRALAAIQRFAALVAAMAVAEVHVVATAAVRDAANGGEFLAAAAQRGVEIRVLTGPEEAAAAARGVMSAIPDAQGIAVDLGGGSLELAEVSGGDVGRTASFPLGIQRLAALLQDGPVAFSARIGAMLADAGWPGPATGQRLYLVGGSWRALARLDMELSQLSLPMLDHHELARPALGRLTRALARMTADDLRAVPGLAASRAALLPEAAALLTAVVRHVKARTMIVTSSGLREGLLFANLSADLRGQDPLIAAAEHEGKRLARFAAHGRRLDAWLAPLFAGDDRAGARLRLAACLLSDVAWSANPDYRAARAVEIALHGNWRAVTPAERVILAHALHIGFGGAPHDFALHGAGADPAALNRARQWGLAIRLAQRLSGGLPSLLDQCRLFRRGDALVLEFDAGASALAGEPVARRLRHLAAAMGLSPLVEVGR